MRTALPGCSTTSFRASPSPTKTPSRYSSASSRKRSSTSYLRSEEHTSELQSRGQLVCRHLHQNKTNTLTICTNNESILFKKNNHLEKNINIQKMNGI